MISIRLVTFLGSKNPIHGVRASGVLAAVIAATVGLGGRA